MISPQVLELAFVQELCVEIKSSVTDCNLQGDSEKKRRKNFTYFQSKPTI